MIPLTSIEYELKERPDKVLSRLNWAVEEVELSWIDDLNKWNSGPSTDKDWIGEINERDYNFILKEPGSLLQQKIKVILKGQLEFRSTSTCVKINLGLTNASFTWILMVYILTAMMISELFMNEGANSYGMIIIFLIAFPVFGTFMIVRRMKRAEKNLDKLFK